MLGVFLSLVLCSFIWIFTTGLSAYLTDRFLRLYFEWWGADRSSDFAFTCGIFLMSILFGFIGGIVGLIVGLVSSTDDELIQYNSQEELFKLNDYAKYYFIYDEVIENKYVEIK